MTKTITQRILDGECDNEMADILNACDVRREIQTQEMNLKAGDRVAIHDDARPRCIAGATGVIVRRRATKFVVDLDHSHFTPGQNGRRWKDGIVCRPSGLRKL